MRTLHLNLKRKWFDMIKSGEKPEEYREIKPAIVSLLFDWKRSGLSRYQFVEACRNVEEFIWAYLKHDGDADITFSNGYATDRDQYKIIWNGIDVDFGEPKWGAEPGKPYFVLKLGNVLTNQTDIL